MKLWLLRHAPVIAEAGLCYGATDLDAAQFETTAAAAAIASELPHGVAVHCSPLQRCRMLASAIEAVRPDLQAHVDARLSEMDFGTWEGRLWKAIERAEMKRWTDDFADTRVGGHGESVRIFMQRIEAAWDDWRASGNDALWVVHAGVMRAVQLLHGGVRCPDNASQWPGEPIEFGSWRVFEQGVAT